MIKAGPFGAVRRLLRLSSNEVRARAANFAGDWGECVFENAIVWQSAEVGGEHVRPICRELTADNRLDADQTHVSE